MVLTHSDQAQESPANTGQSATPIRDEEIWSDDVQIVLIAQDCAFRVPKKILAATSSVFADMLTCATPDADRLDGCPTVRLPSISPVELRPFLRLVSRMGPSDFAYIDQELATNRYTCAQLNSIIRVAHRYQAGHIVDAAIKRLSNAFSLEYVNRLPYLASVEQNSVVGYLDSFLSLVPCRMTIKLRDAFEVVNIAHLVGKTELLPLALLRCLSCDPACLRDGIIRADGELERLSVRDYERCIYALPLLGVAHREYIKDTYNAYRKDAFKSCKSQDGQCKNKVKELMADLIDLKPDWRLLRSLFCTVLPVDHGLCESCFDEMDVRIVRKGKEALKNIPAYFALDVHGVDQDDRESSQSGEPS